MPTVDRVVAGYRLLRDQKKEIQDRHKDELAPYNRKLYKMELWLQDALNKAGAQNITTPHGTAYTSTVMKAKVDDFDAFWEYVRMADASGLIEQRASKDAVEEHIESNGEPPPGVSVTYETNVRVRK